VNVHDNNMTMTNLHKLPQYGAFHKWGTQNGWFISIGKSIYQWMMTAGTEILGTPHIWVLEK
jgi:hypothetical protein